MMDSSVRDIISRVHWVTLLPNSTFLSLEALHKAKSHPYCFISRDWNAARTTGNDVAPFNAQSH